MKPYIISLLILLPTLGFAQDMLRLEEAVQVAMENNFDLKIARLNQQVVENNAHPGNAGLFPKLDLTAGANYSNSNGSATFPVTDSAGNRVIDPATGEQVTQKVSANGIETNSQNIGLGLTYTVFDGLGNVYNYRVLKTNVQLSDAQTRALMEGTLSQVISAYYQVARLQGNLRITNESLSLSRDRLNFINNQNEFGVSNGLAVLNAEVDLNTDSVNVATVEMNLANAKRDLNMLLGRNPGESFTVSEDISWQRNLRMEDIYEQARQANSGLATAEYNRKISELNVRLAQAGTLPRLDVNVNYGFNRNDNGPFGFVRTTTGLGLNAGANLSFNIFNGNRSRVNKQNAEISLASSNTALQQVEQQLLHDVQNAYANYRNSISIYRLEQKNLEAAKANFSRTKETFELGQATNVQFRNAQLNLQQVEQRLNELQYNIKLNETELMRLSGQLVPVEAG